MSVFEPATVLAILKNSSLVPAKDREQFEKKWKDETGHRLKTLLKSKDLDESSSSSIAEQLKWESHVVEYVSFIFKKCRLHGNTKSAMKIPPSLPKDIPLLGPRFLPPTYLHVQKRDPTPLFKPTTAYLKPTNIIHPLYYPNINRCPQCDSDNTTWDGWNLAGHRDLHGIRGEETAMGYQLVCNICAKKSSCANTGKRAYCVSTTNTTFWEKWEHWEIPRGIPYFLKRCAVTRELFDLVIEMRPSTTAKGLFEHIKQLHLLEYQQKRLEYLQYMQDRRPNAFRKDPLSEFSGPYDVHGYAGNVITADLISDLFLEFTERTRRHESEEYLSTLSAKCLSMDNTFHAANKATVVDKEKKHHRILKGGVLTMLNEQAEIIGWRLCQSASPDEMTELLEGYKERCRILNIPCAEMAVVDNCCHVRNAITKALPEITVVLDVYHLSRRYSAVIVNSSKNPYRSDVLKDVVGAVIKKHADKHGPAQYWSQAEQVTNLKSAFDKWAKTGNVWSAAASKVHAEQLRHVQKGCLARTRHDIASDGSRIEASHKGWNSLQRSFASGLEMFTALAHDFVLRRDIRIASKNKHMKAFLEPGFGSHHIRLIDHIAKAWNQLLQTGKNINVAHLTVLPEMHKIASNEKFGLVGSTYIATFGNQLEASTEEDLLFDLPPDDCTSDVAILQELDIDPALCLVPLQLSTEKENRKRASDETVIDAAQKRLRTCTSSSGKSPEHNTIHKFFKAASSPSHSIHAPLQQQQVLKSAVGTGINHPSMIHRVSARLDVPDQRGLTRSQRLFVFTTNIDIRSLSIQGKDEFFLFMEMRAKKGWVSFKMTSRTWVSATEEYNTELAVLQMQHGLPVVKKNPRALLDKLSEVEGKILERLQKNDFKSRNGTESFWRKHCQVIALIKTDPEPVQSTKKVRNNNPCLVAYLVAYLMADQRRPAMCSRCCTIMYPGPPGSLENHKKGLCSDGVKSSMPNAPDWPQPQGIFEDGIKFNPIAFLVTLREVYEATVIQSGDGGDLAVEYEAFIKMVQKRSKLADKHWIFRLYDLEIPANILEELLVEHDGARYLRIDCLCDDHSSDESG